jgi:hypothetical protein
VAILPSKASASEPTVQPGSISGPQGGAGPGEGDDLIVSLGPREKSKATQTWRKEKTQGDINRKE